MGDGPERGRLEAEAAGLGPWARSIHFAGPSDLLRATDAFALPSRAEGMSNSLLEAMATGPTSEIGGNTDLLGPGPVGLLLPPDPDECARTLVRILTVAALAASLGDADRQRVEAEYLLHAVVTRYQALDRDLREGR